MRTYFLRTPEHIYSEKEPQVCAPYLSNPNSESAFPESASEEYAQAHLVNVFITFGSIESPSLYTVEP